MSVRIKFKVSDPKDKGRSADWDSTGGGDYDRASMAMIAVAMGDDAFRERICVLKFGADWASKIEVTPEPARCPSCNSLPIAGYTDDGSPLRCRDEFHWGKS